MEEVGEGKMEEEEEGWEGKGGREKEGARSGVVQLNGPRWNPCFHPICNHYCKRRLVGPPEAATALLLTCTATQQQQQQGSVRFLGGTNFPPPYLLHFPKVSPCPLPFSPPPSWAPCQWTPHSWQAYLDR